MASMRSVLFRVADMLRRVLRDVRDAEQNRRRNKSSADKVSVQHMSIEASRKSIWLLNSTSV